MKNKLRWVVLLCLLAAFQGACAHRYHATYNTFGAADPKRSDQILSEYNRLRNNGKSRKYDVVSHKPAPQSSTVSDISDVVVLDSTVPDGVEYSSGSIGVKPGSDIEILGRFSISQNLYASRSSLLMECQYLAKIAGGNLVMAEFSSEGQLVLGVKGYVFSSPSPGSHKIKPKSNDKPKDQRREL